MILSNWSCTCYLAQTVVDNVGASVEKKDVITNVTYSFVK